MIGICFFLHSLKSCGHRSFCCSGTSFWRVKEGHRTISSARERSLTKESKKMVVWEIFTPTRVFIGKRYLIAGYLFSHGSLLGTILANRDPPCGREKFLLWKEIFSTSKDSSSHHSFGLWWPKKYCISTNPWPWKIGEVTSHFLGHQLLFGRG